MFAVVSMRLFREGWTLRETAVDPYLLTTKLAADAVVAYHAALQFHGKVYSDWRRFQFLTGSRLRRFTFRDLEFVGVQAPAVVRSLPDFGGGVQERPHAGGVVRVTTQERTLVDVLDAPHRCGSWEEVWRSLEMIAFFDLDAVVGYVSQARIRPHGCTPWLLPGATSGGPYG